MKDDNILRLSDVSKAYGDKLALDNISLEVPRGCTFGLLGSNGAGKTTMLRIVCSILQRDRGEVTIDGVPASQGETTRLIGYMPEERGLYPKMRVDEQVTYFARLKGFKQANLMENMKKYMDMLEIADADRHRRVEELSKGNQQKVQILSTIVHDPPLIILDEPFSGFDPINSELLQALIETLRQRGSTLILSSHNMGAIEQMCSHIALISQGRLLLSGELEKIKDAHRTGRFYIGLDKAINTAMVMDTDLLEAIEQVQPRMLRHKGAYSILPKKGADTNEILSAMGMQAHVLCFDEQMPSLSSLFISYTTGR